jgi:hypothetical protein
MAAEMTEHVGYEKHDAEGNNSGNSRNGMIAPRRGATLRGFTGHLRDAIRWSATTGYSRATLRVADGDKSPLTKALTSQRTPKAPHNVTKGQNVECGDLSPLFYAATPSILGKSICSTCR